MTGGRRSGIPAGDDVVFIGGIPQEVTQGDVRTLLNRTVGGVQRVRFMICHKTRHHKGFGFARFVDAESAERAVQISKKRGLRLGFGVLNLGPSTYKPDSSDESSNQGSSGSSEQHVRRQSESEECDDFDDMDLPGLLEDDEEGFDAHAPAPNTLAAFAAQHFKLPAAPTMQAPQQLQPPAQAQPQIYRLVLPNGQSIALQPAAPSLMMPSQTAEPLHTPHPTTYIAGQAQPYFLVPSSFLFPQVAHTAQVPAMM